MCANIHACLSNCDEPPHQNTFGQDEGQEFFVGGANISGCQGLQSCVYVDDKAGMLRRILQGTGSRVDI